MRLWVGDYSDLMRAGAFVFLAMAIGCHPAPLATVAPSSSDSSTTREPPRLVWDDVLSKWSGIDVAVGRAMRRVSLDSVEDQCISVLLARNAQVMFNDLDGDGADDLALWSPSENCWVFWRAWKHAPSVTPVQISLRCSVAENHTNVKLCWGNRLSPEMAGEPSQMVIIVRNDRLDQIVVDRDFSPAGHLELVDVTFDERPDLLVPTSAGCTGNCWVNVWPYSTRSKRFVASPSLSRLANVVIVDPKDRLVESRECGGQACAVFTARLLQVYDDEAQVVAEATQDDAAPGSLTKRLRVTSRAKGLESKFACEALVDADGSLQQRLSGTCERWPWLPAH